jgi:tetratricopeptide (TPR) repeat protein
MNPPPHTLAQVENLVSQAAAALGSREPARACALAEQATRLLPDHAAAQHLAGRALLELNQLGRALDHLRQAASLDSRNAEYLAHLARALARAKRLGEALQVANIAAARPPADAETPLLLGMVYMDCNVHERANAAFRRAVAMAPQHALGHFNLAVTLTFTGHIDEAEAAFDTCLALQPDFWAAYGLRSRLRRQTSARNHVAQLQALLHEHAANDAAQMHLHSALGKECEDQGDFAGAFAHFTRGKAVRSRQRRHDSAEDRALVDAMIRAFPEPRPQASGYGSEEPIFIVGMPRSGTTLVERIISSHPQVHSAGELLNFPWAVKRLSDAGQAPTLSPAVIDGARGIDLELLGLRYIDGTRPQTANQPRFIDKLPHNFLYAGFIAHALPRAKIICLRRNPMDTCLSNFRELFQEHSAFHGYTFDLLDIGRFYIQFERMMAHWRRVLPGRILEIGYETLVAEQESSTRRLLDFCELPWHEACLHFERNPSAVATASTVQAREPIHRNAVRRWEKYGELLEPLERLLNDAGIATRG